MFVQTTLASKPFGQKFKLSQFLPGVYEKWFIHVSKSETPLTPEFYFLEESMHRKWWHVMFCPVEWHANEVLVLPHHCHITTSQPMYTSTYHSIYIRTVSSSRLLSSLLIQFKVVCGPFGQSNMHFTLDLCLEQPGKNQMYQS